MKKRIFAAALATLGSGLVHAGPADYLYTPHVEYGEREFEFRAGTERDRGKEAATAGVLGFGVGVTQSWFTEVAVEFERERGENFRYEAFEWENKFQLTEPGEFPIDLGVLVEIERARDHAEGWELKLGLLTQKDFGKLQVNVNLLSERHFDAEARSVTELGYQWQAKYRWRPALEFGLQGFGEVGKWDNWESAEHQEHKIGPAIFGKLPAGGRQAIKYDAAYLVGLTRATPDHTLRLAVEYEY